MRICMITTFYPPYNFGGDGIFVERLSHALARRGHQVEVIHCVDAFLAGGGTHRPAMARQEHHNVTVHSLKSPFGLLSPLATQQTGRPFFKSARILKILESGFDVIHYHNISLVGGPKILEFGTGIKLYSMHEYWLVCPTHVLFKFNKDVCTSPSCMPCQLSYLRPPQWWRNSSLLKESAKHVDAFIVPDLFTLQKHHEMGFEGPMVHLPHFMPREHQGVTPILPISPPAMDDPYFLFVGRLEKLKGLQSVIQVFARYRRAELRIAGTGAYESQLRKLAGDAPNIRFLGFVSGEQLKNLYRRAVAVVVPSVNYEVSPPLVALEGFAVGTPAIVRHIGSMPALVEESGGGCSFSSDQALVAAMDQLLDKPSYRRHLGMKAHDYYCSKLNEERYVGNYIDLVNGIRAQKAARRQQASLAVKEENQ